MNHCAFIPPFNRLCHNCHYEGAKATEVISILMRLFRSFQSFAMTKTNYDTVCKRYENSGNPTINMDGFLSVSQFSERKVDKQFVSTNANLFSCYKNWSSTTNVNNTDNAWNVNFNNGNVNNNNKTNNNYVRPVRGGQLSKEDIFSFKNLYKQYINCRKRKRNTINALRFEINLEENIINLQKELLSDRYYPSRSVVFIIKKPKFREIIAADFRDRIVHHVIVDHLEKKWEKDIYL